MADLFRLDPGELDQRLSLLQPALVKDSLGQRVTTYALVTTVWARLLSMVSREAARAGAIDGGATLGFRVNWRTGIDRTWRVQWRGRQYELVAEPIDVKGARVALDLMCTEARS